MTYFTTRHEDLTVSDLKELEKYLGVLCFKEGYHWIKVLPDHPLDPSPVIIFDPEGKQYTSNCGEDYQGVIDEFLNTGCKFSDNKKLAIELSGSFSLFLVSMFHAGALVLKEDL